MKQVFYPKLRLAIDGNEANVIKRLGSNVYAYKILSSLYDLVKKSRNPRFEVTVLLASEPVKDMPKVSSFWRYQVLKPKPFFTQLALPYYLLNQKNKFDLFYTPSHYGPSVCPLPMVSSVMDLAFLRYPKQFTLQDRTKLKLWTKQTVKKAKKVVTISQFSKLETMRFYHRRAKDVVVAYPAVDARPRLSSLKRAIYLKKQGLNRPYLLYLGTLQPRKNLVRLILAYEHLVRRAIKDKKLKKRLPHLILAGKVGWLAEEIILTARRSPFADKIKLLGFVSEEEKAYLLSKAVAGVQVGLYEGFGIPVLEAYRFGTPVVVSNTSSLPEVAGRAGIYVDPTSVNDITEGLTTAVNLTARKRQALKKLMRTQLDRFSWEKSAQVVLETLMEVAKQAG